ncbi:hypothetical protein R83H12_00767 [Fibrobacteria bacterium R8-3-H12]
MEQPEKKFAIRHITKADDEDYKKALMIYKYATAFNIKMSDEAITTWIEKQDNRLEILVFALYLNENVVGFAMMSYIKEARIVMLEYIELQFQHRADNAVFFPYIKLLENFLKENSYDYKYIVSEISKKDEESRFFRKISFIEGFGKIEANYFTPPIHNIYGSSSKAFLYIKSNDYTDTISKDCYMEIASAIHNDYHRIWNKGFLSPENFDKFSKSLDKSFYSIQKRIGSSKSFKINYSPGTLFATRSKKRVFFTLIAIIALICALLLLCQYIGIETASEKTATITGILSSVITGISTFFAIKEKDW